jgi:hypothetical protein
VVEREGEAGMSGDGVRYGRKEIAKGLRKRVLWVGSMGKGSWLRDWKGLAWLSNMTHYIPDIVRVH